MGKPFDWREMPETEWNQLLENIDPDWRDRFMMVEQGLEFYDEYPEKDFDGLTHSQNAVRQYLEDEGGQ